MSEAFEFVAESRAKSGTSAARVARRKGLVPAVVYGGHAEPRLVSLSHNEVLKHLAHEAVYSHVLNLSIDGSLEQVVLKGMQRHPAKAQVLHMDFMRVSMQEEIKVHVPIHFEGTSACIGLKAGGLMMPLQSDIEVVCLPGALPEFIKVDISGLAVGESIHLHDLTPPNGVRFSALMQAHDDEHDLAIVRIAAPVVASTVDVS